MRRELGARILIPRANFTMFCSGSSLQKQTASKLSSYQTEYCICSRSIHSVIRLAPYCYKLAQSATFRLLQFCRSCEMKRPRYLRSTVFSVLGMSRIRTRVTFRRNLRNQLAFRGELRVGYPTSLAPSCTTYRKPAKKSLGQARLSPKTQSYFLVQTPRKPRSSPSPWPISKSFILPPTVLLTRSFQKGQAWSWVWTAVLMMMVSYRSGKSSGSISMLT